MHSKILPLHAFSKVLGYWTLIYKHHFLLSEQSIKNIFKNTVLIQCTSPHIQMTEWILKKGTILERAKLSFPNM